MRYTPNYRYDHRTIKFGATYSALKSLGERKGYRLVEDVAYGSLLFVLDSFDVVSRLVTPTLPPKEGTPGKLLYKMDAPWSSDDFEEV